MTPDETAALDRLRAALRRSGRVAVAYSGGLDSTLLLAVAHQVLGPDAIAVTAQGPVYDRDDLDFAREFARSIGVRHELIDGVPLSHPCFAEHPVDRCYHCKRQVFSKALELVRSLGFPVLADATNQDDLTDHRPGRKAAEELGVISPLLEAQIGKDMVRRLTRGLGLPGADRPSRACLATRVPFGTPVTLDAIEKAATLERSLRSLGFKIVRARVHGDLCRIEVGNDELARFLDPEVRIAARRAGLEAGFKHLTLDLAGYRPGGG